MRYGIASSPTAMLDQLTPFWPGSAATPILNNGEEGGEEGGDGGGRKEKGPKYAGMHCSADFSKSLGVGRYRSYPHSRYYCMILLGFYPGSRASFMLDVSFVPRLRNQNNQSSVSANLFFLTFSPRRLTSADCGSRTALQVAAASTLRAPAFHAAFPAAAVLFAHNSPR